MLTNLSYLRAFAAVAEQRSFTAAAVSLGVSQPAVSRAVRELERACGFTLLERTPRNVRLTREGVIVLEDARTVLAAVRSADERIAQVVGLSRGRLHVAATSTIAPYVLPAYVGRFIEEHPSIDLRLTTAHTRDVQQMLLDYAVDLGLTEAAVTHPRIRSRRWGTDRLVVIASPAHPLAGRRPVPPAALNEELLLLREPAAGTRKIVNASLRAIGIAPSRTIEVDGPEAIKQIVAHSRGIAIVSQASVAEQVALGRLVVLDVTGLHIERPFFRLSLAGHRGSPAARAFDAILDDRGGARARRR
ncbi:MAG: LysR family transcriptional regulator [Gemmatimonadetes bacterium]|nr:LysR family transcriptional regulator [Gemmatimonadota bacterium]